MKINIKNIVILLSLNIVFAASSFAQKAKVVIYGGQKTVYTCTLDVLEKLPQTKLKASDHQGVIHSYQGVEIVCLLKKAGAPLGTKLRGKNLQKYMLVNALDGYKAVFALPEIDPSFSDDKIILATKMDGKLLSSAEGPFQIIVEGEKKHARFVRQVKSIMVKQAN